MTQYSHSRIETFLTCPYKFKLTYLDGLETLPNTDPSNALTVGLALHKGVEEGVKEGLKQYFNSFPIINDLQINEAIKLEYLIPKVREFVPSGSIFEEEINTPDFKGFIDLLTPVSEDGDFKVFDLWDFKYSNHVDRYLKSPQLQLYKFFYEKTHPFHTIRNLGFIFAPKTQIRQKKTEDIYQFRKRLLETLDTLEVKQVTVDYDPTKVIEFLINVKRCSETTEFPKNPCRLCDFCDFKLFCEQGDTYMLLPSTARRTVNPADRMKIMIFGAPFSGKSTFANKFPTPLFLNTDGNINSFDAPYLSITDSWEGRQKVFAWENFKDIINQLSKGSDFKTIVVDLVDGVAEHCRRYVLDKLGIEHESEAAYGKAYKMIEREFFDVMRQLLNLQYHIVLISHENTNESITSRSGATVTKIKCTLRDALANGLCSMVDIVGRVVVEDDVRTLRFKNDAMTFGGGRLTLKSHVIPLEYDALEELYENQPKTKAVSTQAPTEQSHVGKVVEQEHEGDEAVAEKVETSGQRSGETDATPRTRKNRKVEESTTVKDAESSKVATKDDLANAMTSAIEKHGKAVINKLVRETFNISKLNELDPSQYQEVIDTLNNY